MKKICPVCNKRETVIDDLCGICIFFYSDIEQERFYRVVGKIFETIPESVGYDRDKQIRMAYLALPYICIYKAQYKKELTQVLNDVIEDCIEEVDIEVS